MIKYYVYVLQSEKDKNFYVGYTNDLSKRIRQHNEGNVNSTKDRRLLRLV
ncbi:MAG: GIY-YIG nuclease family protein, partial [Candidatus Marinimicrobia bacterium]|nr:GIY-YIG nuclease family protein [Candidatus Neomarinimicrobiota bacterium]